MKTNYKIFFTAVILFCGITVSAQQQSVYTNYLFNIFGYNPAFAGSQKFMQANLYYRNQWTGFEGAPKTYLVSMNGPLKKIKNMGIGGMVMTDKSGLLGRNSAHVSAAYHIDVNSKTRLAGGLSLGFIQYNVKIYDVKAYDAGDYLLTGNILAGNALDANTGIYLYNPKYFVSISCQQMFNNKIKWKDTQGKLIRQFNTILGYNYKVDKDFTIQPSVLIKGSQPVPAQVDFSLKCIYKDMVSLAASLRNNKNIDNKFKSSALAFMVEYKAIKKITVGYSYDLSLNTIRKYNTGSHELYLAYNFIKKKHVDVEEEQFKVIDNSIKHSIKNKKEEKK